MSELNVWLSTHHPGLLAAYDRQRREGSTQLGLVGWLIFYHSDVWDAYQAARVVVAPSRHQMRDGVVRKAETVDA